jgi:hypothetical protein
MSEFAVHATPGSQYARTEKRPSLMTWAKVKEMAVAV